MRRVARLVSSAACKRGGAVKRVDGYGRVPRLTIEFRYFECGRNIKAFQIVERDEALGPIGAANVHFRRHR
jgi:hypothetical protein